MTAEPLRNWRQQQRKSCALGSSTRSVCAYTTLRINAAQQLKSLAHHTSHFDNGIHRVSPTPLLTLTAPYLRLRIPPVSPITKQLYCVSSRWASHLRMLIHSSSEWPTALHAILVGATRQQSTFGANSHPSTLNNVLYKLVPGIWMTVPGSLPLRVDYGLSISTLLCTRPLKPYCTF